MTSQIRVPTRIDLTRPTLEAIHLLGGSASIAEIDSVVAQQMGLSDDALNVPHRGGPQTEFEYRSAWARTELKRYGLVDNSSRGIWALTPKGKETKTIDPNEVERANREVYRMRRRGIARPLDEREEASIDEFDEESTSWQENLIEALLQMSPDAFERLCQRLLRESGFIEVEVTGRSGDGGIDGHGIIRMGGLISFPVLFQCKRYQGSVTPDKVRDFRGAMAGRSDKGLLITTGSFTREAKKEATRDGVSPIDLIDGNLLAEKLKELSLGVKTAMVEHVTVDRDWFNSI